MNKKFGSWSFCGAIGIFVIYLFHYLIMGQDLYIPIHDNFDSGHSWLTLFAKHSNWLGERDSYLLTHYWMLPSSSYPPSTSIITWTYRIFTPLVAYLFNVILVHTIAFFGAFSLIKSHLTKNETFFNQKIAPWISLCYAILPYSIFMTASIAGIPLFFSAFLSIRKGEKNIANWMLLITLPFYSSLALSYIYVLPFIFGLLVYDTIKHRQIVYSFWALSLASIAFLVSESSILFNFLLDSSFSSHRTEFVRQALTLKESILIFAKLFILGHYHSPPKHTLTLIVLFLTGAWSLVKYRRLLLDRSMVYLTSTIVAICLFGGFLRYQPIYDLIGQSTLFRVFNFERLYILLPFLWLIIFCKLCHFLSQRQKHGALTLFLVIQTGYHISQIDTLTAYRETRITYRQFLAEPLFQKIKEHLNKENRPYKTVSVGLEPAITIFNDLPAVDFYTVNYDIKYKHQFRSLIEAELDKSDSLKKYFDHWGSRVYFYSAELFDNCFTLCVNPRDTVAHISLTQAGVDFLKNTYIISAVSLENSNLEHIETFTDLHLPWTIRIYRVPEHGN